MAQKSILLFVAACVLFAPIACFATEPNIYHDAKSNFSIVIPNDWEKIYTSLAKFIAESNIQGDLGLVNPGSIIDLEADKDTFFFHKIGTKEDVPPLLLIDIPQKEAVEIIKKSTVKYSVNKVLLEMIDKRDGRDYEKSVYDKTRNIIFMNTMNQGNETIEYQVIILDDAGSVRLTFLSSALDRGADLLVFNEIIDSFKFGN